MIVNQMQEAPNVLILGNPKGFNKPKLMELLRHYRVEGSVPLFYGLPVDERDAKVKKKHFLESLDEVGQILDKFSFEAIVVTDATYFKFMYKDATLMNAIGSAVTTNVAPFSDYPIVPNIPYSLLYFQPQKQKLLEQGNDTLERVLNNTYTDAANMLDDVTVNLIDTLEETKKLLPMLNEQPKLALDIEATGLLLTEQIITIGMAVSDKETYVFATCREYSDEWEAIKEELKKFFIGYTGEQIWYNAMFDVPFILRNLLDIPLIDSTQVSEMVNKWNLTDAMHLNYLLHNGLERHPLGLKDFLMPYYGNYDSGVDQSRLIEYPFATTGTYNGYDTTGTFLAYNKLLPAVEEYGQLDLFNGYYKKALKLLIKVKSSGLVVSRESLDAAEEELQTVIKDAEATLYSSSIIKDFNEDLRYDAAFKYNATHKVKKKTKDDFKDLIFNPGSNLQKANLLINVMDYPVLEKTKTGNPSVGKDVINQYLATEGDPERKEVLSAMLNVAEGNKISGTFLKAFYEQSCIEADGTYRIHGNYKLHGTVSGRLSSSDPNLQNLPSGSAYGKLIKKLFVAPSGFLFASADYNALEDRLLAEETRDPAKVKILTDGYDGHSFNAASYFEAQLKDRGLPYGPNVTKEECDIIKKEAPDLRQDGKQVTFGLAYGATEHSVSHSLGISLDDAKVILNNYWKAYPGVRKYYTKYLMGAKNTKNIVLTPHGLKIRAPELQATDELARAKAERSVQNALIQGLGGQLMVSRLVLMQEAIEEQGYTEDVQIVNTIHDAVYFYIREDAEIIKWVNDVLIGDIMVRDYKENQLIENKAELEIGPNWATQVELVPFCPVEDIEEVLKGLAT